jgi:hypothetical protein
MTIQHRIYRDVRFSNDKTPYKRHFSASISRSGRKGIWAGCEFFPIDDGGEEMESGLICYRFRFLVSREFVVGCIQELTQRVICLAPLSSGEYERWLTMVLLLR